MKKINVLMWWLTAWLLSGFAAILFAQEQKVLVYGDESDRNRVYDFVDKGFVLESIDIQTQGLIAEDEALYLLGLTQGCYVTGPMLVRGINNLFKKNKFNFISMVSNQDFIGKKLTIICSGIWTLRNVSLTGVLIGKEVYKQYYVLEPGDVFDQKKHMHALERIQEVLRKDGYIEAKVDAEIVYDQKTMEVDVSISLIQGPSFALGEITVSCNDKQAKISGEPIAHKAKIFLDSVLAQHHYKWFVVNSATAQLKKYLAKRGFSSIKIELNEYIDHAKKKVSLHFVLDAAQKKEFWFYGNHFFTRDQLAHVISSFGSTISIIPASMLVAELKHFYYAKGFWSTKVMIKDGESRCLIYITEGPRIKIRNIDFKNIFQCKKNSLAKLFRRILKRKYFDAELMQQSLEDIEAWYTKQGYLQMRIAQQEYVPCGDNAYSLVLTIEEGEPHFIGEIIIDGYSELLDEGPFASFTKLISEHSSIPLDMAMLQEQKRWLLNYFRNRGYMKAQVDVDVRGQKNALKVVWTVNPGLLTYFGKTIVQGSHSLPNSMILRELCYDQGNICDANKIRASQKRLHELNIFESVYMHPDTSIEQDSQSQECNVMVKVCKDSPYEVRLRGGFGLQQVGKNFALGTGITYKVGGTFIAKNPFHKADQIFIEADLSRTQNSVNLEYRCPWLFNQPIRTCIKGYAVRYDQPGFVGSKERLYRIMRYGAITNLMRSWSHIEWMSNLGFEWSQTSVAPHNRFRADMIGRAINFEHSLLNVKIPYFIFEPTVVVDYIDNKLSPRYGSFTLCSMKAMIPVNSEYRRAQFVRLYVEQSFFRPLAHRFIGAVRFRLGHIFHECFNAVMPAERFYLGGANSVRSYDTDLCPPLGTYIDDGCQRIAPQGGKTMININLEGRFLCYRMLEIAFFQDAGYLVGTGHHHILGGHFVAATGVGVRYNTPLGPLRFDIAWKWHTNRIFENTYAWFLRLGHTF